MCNGEKKRYISQKHLNTHNVELQCKGNEINDETKFKIENSFQSNCIIEQSTSFTYIVDIEEP